MGLTNVIKMSIAKCRSFSITLKVWSVHTCVSVEMVKEFPYFLIWVARNHPSFGEFLIMCNMHSWHYVRAVTADLIYTII